MMRKRDQLFCQYDSGIPKKVDRGGELVLEGGGVDENDGQKNKSLLTGGA